MPPIYKNFADAVKDIVKHHPEYDKESYYLLDRTIGYASAVMKLEGHLSAEQLHLCYCKLAQEEFGPLAYEVLENWGIKDSPDLGAIVYNLIEIGVFGRDSDDEQSDFNSLPSMQRVIDLLIEQSRIDTTFLKQHFFQSPV